MKKTLLSLLGGAWLLCGSGAVYAQTYTVEAYTLEDSPELDEVLQGTQIHSVSANGEWAVGYPTDYSELSFVWSRSTGKFTLIGGALDDKTYAYGVADDGTVAGVFADDNNGEVASGKTPYYLPGIYKDGKWTPLELVVPKKLGDANGEARWISGDGRIVTGYVKDYFKRNVDGVEKEVALYRPAVWIDGKLQPRWENFPTGDEINQGCFSLYGSSQDGTVVSGYYEFPTGSRVPAVWVNGELRKFFRQTDIDPDVDEYFCEGMSSTVSPNGKYVGGYYSADGSGYDAVGFIHDVEANTTVQPENCALIYSCLNDGTAFGSNGAQGSALVYIGGKSMTYDEYIKSKYNAEIAGGTAPSAINSSSADGRVMGGYFVGSSDMGLIMHPSVVVVSEGADGIASAVADKPALTLRYGVVMADGAESVEVFDLAGRKLGSAQASAFSVAGQRGTVIAKATYADGEVKVAKLQVR